MLTDVGVVGAGRMGLPIAARWRAAGHDVAVYDAAPSRQDAARDQGLHVEPDLRHLAERGRVLVTILPGAPEVEAVLTDALPHLRAGSVWLDLSSSDPQLTERLAGLASGAGVGVVAAPMGGNPDAAAAAALTFYTAGDDASVASVEPLLQLCGQVVPTGTRPAHAHAVKLLANLLWFGQAVATTEAMLLGTALGMDVELLSSVLASSAGGSAFIDRDLPALLDGDDLESFGIDGCVAELETVDRLAEHTGTPFDLSQAVLALYRQALAHYGPVPGELLAARLVQERAGRELRRG